MNFQDAPLFDKLLREGPFSSRELVMIIMTAPERYKNHTIVKRHGRGTRLISQPTAEVKYLQRFIVHKELSSLSLHESAVGFRIGKSILHHAAPHAKAKYLLKLDFKDFFPSLKIGAIHYRLRQDTRFADQELWILGQILCRKDFKTQQLQLSIGAPSSPFLSNYLMFEFDQRMGEFCRAKGVVYTRYADDLAFSTSTPYLLDTVYSEVKKSLNEFGYLGLALNEEKTVNVSTKNRRTLVGLNLANQGTASVGRDEKRKLRAAMHYLSLGHLKASEISILRGKMAFIYGIDPKFVVELCAKYGYSKVSDIGGIHLVKNSGFDV